MSKQRHPPRPSEFCPLSNLRTNTKVDLSHRNCAVSGEELHGRQSQRLWQSRGTARQSEYSYLNHTQFCVELIGVGSRMSDFEENHADVHLQGVQRVRKIFDRHIALKLY